MQRTVWRQPEMAPYVIPAFFVAQTPKGFEDILKKGGMSMYGKRRKKHRGVRHKRLRPRTWRDKRRRFVDDCRSDLLRRKKFLYGASTLEMS